MKPYYACSFCTRYVKRGDAACPFCGALNRATNVLPRRRALRTSRAQWLAYGSTLAVVGCTGGATAGQVEAGVVDDVTSAKVEGQVESGVEVDANDGGDLAMDGTAKGAGDADAVVKDAAACHACDVLKDGRHSVRFCGRKLLVCEPRRQHRMRSGDPMVYGHRRWVALRVRVVGHHLRQPVRAPRPRLLLGCRRLRRRIPKVRVCDGDLFRQRLERPRLLQRRRRGQRLGHLRTCYGAPPARLERFVG